MLYNPETALLNVEVLLLSSEMACSFMSIAFVISNGATLSTLTFIVFAVLVVFVIITFWDPDRLVPLKSTLPSVTLAVISAENANDSAETVTSPFAVIFNLPDCIFVSVPSPLITTFNADVKVLFKVILLFGVAVILTDDVLTSIVVSAETLILSFYL